MVWMLLIGVLFLSQSLVYGAAVDLEKLGDKDQPQTVLLESDFRDIDLVVFNDLYDIRWQDRAFYHRVWQKIGSPDIRQTFAMDMLVLLALAEGQIVVCPKKMWRCIAFLHDFFVDVQGLSVAEILQKHQLPDSFQRLLIKYKSRFMAYNNLSLTLDDDDSFCFLPKDDDFSVAALLFLFGFDHLYQIFLQQHYQCKEVNDLYVVFIPQGTLDKHNQAVQKSTVTSLDCIAPGLTALDMSLGMHWSTLPDYRHQEDWRLQETKLLDQRASEGLSFTELGAFLKDALQKLLINKNSISKSFQRFIPVVLPYFNFYMHGHGSARDKIVGIHTDDLGVILQRLQHQVNTHSVGLVSCYIGGKRFNDVFGHSYQSLNSWVDQITYPILFGGSFFLL